jgi:hypothetical protein
VLRAPDRKRLTRLYVGQKRIDAFIVIVLNFRVGIAGVVFLNELKHSGEL